MAGRRKIENGQAPMSERNTAGVIDPDARVIRPTVMQRVGHSADNCGTVTVIIGRMLTPETCQATHSSHTHVRNICDNRSPDFIVRSDHFLQTVIVDDAFAAIGFPQWPAIIVR